MSENGCFVLLVMMVFWGLLLVSLCRTNVRARQDEAFSLRGSLFQTKSLCSLNLETAAPDSYFKSLRATVRWQEEETTHPSCSPLPLPASPCPVHTPESGEKEEEEGLYCLFLLIINVIIIVIQKFWPEYIVILGSRTPLWRQCSSWQQERTE